MSLYIQPIFSSSDSENCMYSSHFSWEKLCSLAPLYHISITTLQRSSIGRPGVSISFAMVNHDIASKPASFKAKRCAV